MQIYFLPIMHTAVGNRETELSNFISPQRQETVNSYRSSIDQKLSLYAELLTLMGLSTVLSKPYTDVALLHERMHKPKLAEPCGIDFNYSHTHQAVLCGITDLGHIGVDLERIDTPPLGIMKHVFHPEEISYVESGSIAKKDDRFFEIWTKKEAYTKYLGTGLSIPLTDVNTLDADFIRHCRTWTQDTYMCSVYADMIDPFHFSILSEEDLYTFFINSV